jgi:SEC-C motif-containing protein
MNEPIERSAGPRELSLCPCKSRETYAACCQPFHFGRAKPETAVQLMRSRYAAFVLEREAYLLATWHPGHRPAHIEFDSGVNWLGLEVRDYRLTGADKAEVEFVARHKPTIGPAIRLHERSRFLRDGDHWFYLNGTQY